jgi:hypothetical protein
LAFFVTEARQGDASARAAGATLSLVVVDQRDPAYRSEPVALTPAIRIVDPQTFVVSSDVLRESWMPKSLAYDTLARVLESSEGSRDAMTILAVLDLPAAGRQPRQQFTVALGPRTRAPRSARVPVAGQ